MWYLLFVLVGVGANIALGIDREPYAADPSEIDLVNLVRRLEEFERHDSDRENERKLWKEKLDDMQIEFAVIQAENKQMKDDIVTLKDIIGNIERENKHLKDILLNIETDNLIRDQLDTVFGNNGTRRMNQTPTSKLLKRSESVRRNVDFLSATNSKSNRRIRRAGIVHRQQRLENERGVAFYAVLTNHLKHVGAGQSIVFDSTITNVGNAYNVLAGDFRAPVDGTYSFSATLRAHGTNATHYYINRNSTTVGKLAVMGNHAPYSSSSMTVVLKLIKGDSVSVHNVDSDETLNGNLYSVFSGFLLQEDYSSISTAGTIIG